MLQVGKTAIKAIKKLFFKAYNIYQYKVKLLNEISIKELLHKKKEIMGVTHLESIKANGLIEDRFYAEIQ
jgi:hypothetical protein